MTPNEFIQTIAPLVQKYAPKYNIKVVSPIIAQACLQSAYGTSKKAKFHNYFGLKYRANRVTVNNGYFEDGGSEQNLDGSYRLLPSGTAWYAFDSMEAGVQGYFQFISIPNYANLKTTSDPLTYLQYIKADNYATSLTYVQDVYKVITTYNLTQYDPKQETQPVSTNINIIEKFNTTNTTYSPNRSIKWIVLHYTAGTTSVPGTATNNALWFSKTVAQASADFIVDDQQIVQYNPDPKNRYCWSVGGGKGGSSTSLAGIYYGQCTNSNSISIEMCSRKNNSSTLLASDSDWYFTEATVENAVKLTKYLMKLYNIDINHIIMHHMVTGKICPNPWTLNESRLAGWYNFLKRVDSNAPVYIEPKKQEPIIPEPMVYNYPATPFLINITATNTVYYYSAPNGTKKSPINIGKFTITEVKDNWGKLKSGIGWVNLTNSKITIEQKMPYLVQVIVDGLRIRSGPGTKYTVQGFVNKNIKYTIVEQKNGFGRLKSGAGWISINSKYVKKV